MLTVGIEDTPQTVAIKSEALDNQREAKRKKEEMIEKKSLEKTHESLVEASYLKKIVIKDNIII